MASPCDRAPAFLDTSGIARCAVGVAGDGRGWPVVRERSEQLYRAFCLVARDLARIEPGQDIDDVRELVLVQFA